MKQIKHSAHWQADRFKQFAEKIESCGIPLPVKTFANSAAIIDMPETCLTTRFVPV